MVNRILRIFILVTLFIGCIDKKPPIKDDNKADHFQSNKEYQVNRDSLIYVRIDSSITSINDQTILPFDLEEKFGPIIQPDFALFDFNEDGLNDLFLEYYALSGNGEKNITEIYLCDSVTKTFSQEASFKLTNMTFYAKQRIFTSYYYGYGGGSALKMKFNGVKMEPIEQIDIDVNDSLEVRLIYNDLIINKVDTVYDDSIRLPKEYRFKKLIKRG